MKHSRAAVSPVMTAAVVIVVGIIVGGGAYFIGQSTAPSNVSTMAVTNTTTTAQTVSGPGQTVTTTVSGAAQTATVTATTTLVSSTTFTILNPTLLPTPVQTSPANGTTFNNYPRTTVLNWQAVPGAAYYIVTVNYYNLGVTTCAGGNIYHVAYVPATSYTFPFVGAQPGSWTVSAVNANGQAGVASPWWLFIYLA